METSGPAARKVSPSMSISPSLPPTMEFVSPGTGKALTNKAYFSTNDARHFTSSSGSPERMAYVNNQIVLTVSADPGISDGFLGLNAVQRRNVKVAAGDEVYVARYLPNSGSELVRLSLILQFVRFRGQQETLDATILEQKLTSQYGGQIFKHSLDELLTNEVVGFETCSKQRIKTS